MPDRPGFDVLCKGCGRSLVTVRLLRDPEIDVLVDHLRVCSASEPLGDTPMLGTILRGLLVRAVDHQMNTDVPTDQAAVTAKSESR